MNWLATILILTGYLLVVKKEPFGMFMQIIGCTLFIVLNIDPAVTTVNTIFLFINIYGIFKWNAPVRPHNS